MIWRASSYRLHLQCSTIRFLLWTSNVTRSHALKTTDMRIDFRSVIIISHDEIQTTAMVYWMRRWKELCTYLGTSLHLAEVQPNLRVSRNSLEIIQWHSLVLELMTTSAPDICLQAPGPRCPLYHMSCTLLFVQQASSSNHHVHVLVVSPPRLPSH